MAAAAHEHLYKVDQEVLLEPANRGKMPRPAIIDAVVYIVRYKDIDSTHYSRYNYTPPSHGLAASSEGAASKITEITNGFRSSVIVRERGGAYKRDRLTKKHRKNRYSLKK